MAHDNLEQQLEDLRNALPRMSQYDRRRVNDWLQRFDDSDPFDRQDRQDIKELLDDL